MRILLCVLLIMCWCMLMPGASAYNWPQKFERMGFQDVKDFTKQSCDDPSLLGVNECYYPQITNRFCLNITLRYDTCKSIYIDNNDDDGNDVGSHDTAVKQWYGMKAFYNRHQSLRRRQMMSDGSCVEMDNGTCPVYECVKDCCLGWKRDSATGLCTFRRGSDYCENGGTYDRIHDKCNCRYGYSGERCDIVICDYGCQNNGVCVRTAYGRRICSCPPYTSGSRCENVICDERCEHGKCIVDGVSPVCFCDPGFYGKTCRHSFNNDSTCPLPSYFICTDVSCTEDCMTDRECHHGHVCCSDGCCNKCVKPTSVKCYDYGNVYRPGQTFMRDKCTSCVCTTSGVVSCRNRDCPAVTCPSGEYIDYTGCCPVCRASNVYIRCSDNMRHIPVKGHNYYADMTDLNVIAFDENGRYLEVRYSPEKVGHCRCHNKEPVSVNVTAVVGDKVVAHCQQLVIVTDVTSPVFLICPGSIYARDNEAVNWREPIAMDNIGIVSLESNFNKGSIFQSDVQIKYTATDYDRNKAYCMFNIFITKTGSHHDTQYGDYDTSQATSSVGIIVGAVGTALIMVIIIVLTLLYRRNRLKQIQYRHRSSNSRGPSRGNQCPGRPHMPREFTINTISNGVYGEVLPSDGNINPSDFAPLPPPYTPPTNPPPYEEHSDSDNKPPSYEVVISQQQVTVTV